MAEKKPAVDIVLAMGGPKKPPVSDDADMESDLPPDYVAAFNDFKEANTPETFWEAVKSCMAAGEEMKKAGKPGGY